MKDIEKVEIEMEEAKKYIELRNTFLRLSENKDFKHVIEEAYFKEEAARWAYVNV